MFQLISLINDFFFLLTFFGKRFLKKLFFVYLIFEEICMIQLYIYIYIYIYMKFVFKGIKFSIRFYSQRGNLVPLRCFTHPRNFPWSLSRNRRSIRTQVDKSEMQAQFTGKHSQPLLIPKQMIHKSSCVCHSQFCLQATPH